jgi:D-amino-acid oxidase
MSDIIVIGCGIIGLTTAIQLQDAGHRVTIWAETIPPETNSNVAAAIWYPFGVGPKERVLPWANHTRKVFNDDHLIPERGVSKIDGVLLFQQVVRHNWKKSDWEKYVVEFHGAVPDDERLGYPYGYLVTTWLIEMDTYLDYLMRRFEMPQDPGLIQGVIHRKTVRSLAEALKESRIVVNCAGWKAAELAGDDTESYPARGQIALVPPLESVTRFYLDEDMNNLTYIVPRPRLKDCVLGGTYERLAGRIDEDSARKPNIDIHNQIIGRCSRFSDEVEDAPILDKRAGLRPGRQTVRLEVEEMEFGERPTRILVHNYGHGGAGVTLCWGCAKEIETKINDILHKQDY